jgi:hypothetical protein
MRANSDDFRAAYFGWSDASLFTCRVPGMLARYASAIGDHDGDDVHGTYICDGCDTGDRERSTNNVLINVGSEGSSARRDG